MGALPVTSRVGGLRDIVVDGDELGGFGRTFTPSNKEALVHAVEEMLTLMISRPDLINERRSNAQEAARRYSARAMAVGYEKLYDELLREGGIQ